MKVRKTLWIARDKHPCSYAMLFTSKPVNKRGVYLHKNGTVGDACSPIGLRPGQCAKFVLEEVK